MKNPTPTKPLVVNHLTKEYGKNRALDQVSIELEPGEIFGLLGPNGAGKTTLVSILTGLVSPTSGTGSIFGYDVISQKTETSRRVGVVPQEIVSHGFFTIDQVLKFHSGYYGLARNMKQIDYLLDKLALTAHRKKLVSQLSGGMKRRLLIAKALVHSPPLLLLDEPTAGVDVELRASLWKFVRELNSQGQTILLTTHYLQEAEELCDRVGVLNEGRLIALDNTRNLIHHLTRRQIKLVVSDDIPDKTLEKDPLTGGYLIEAALDHGETIGEFIKKQRIPPETIIDVSVSEGRLEDAFVKLIQNANGAS